MRQMEDHKRILLACDQSGSSREGWSGGLLSTVLEGATKSLFTLWRQAFMESQEAPIEPNTILSLVGDERWQVVQRIASSPHFAKALQPKDILLYVARRALVENTRVITAKDIAHSVLRRRDDYDPNDDSIVRVQISHLRKKIDLFYAAEGKSELILVSIPKGSYVPQFKSIDKAILKPPLVETSYGGPMYPAETSPVAVVRSSAAWRWLLAAITLIAGVVIALRAFAVILEPRRDGSPHVSANVYARNPLLTNIFGGPLPISIVIADGSLSMVQDALQVQISVHDYIQDGYVNGLIEKVKNAEEKNFLRMAYARKYTSLGEATVAFKCQEVSREFGIESSIKYARFLNVRDFERGNLILIGSHQSVPWVELFESQLNFAYIHNSNTSYSYFTNLKPLPGEQNTFVPIDGKESYVDIAIVPNLGRNGHVLLLRGLTMEANEAAADFLFNPEAMSELSRLGDTTTPIEILLRNNVAEGASSGFEVVAVRHLK